MQATGVNHIILTIGDVDRSRAFYRDVLELRGGRHHRQSRPTASTSRSAASSSTSARRASPSPGTASASSASAWTTSPSPWRIGLRWTPWRPGCWRRAWTPKASSSSPPPATTTSPSATRTTSNWNTGCRRHDRLNSTQRREEPQSPGGAADGSPRREPCRGGPSPKPRRGDRRQHRGRVLSPLRGLGGFVALTHGWHRGLPSVAPPGLGMEANFLPKGRPSPGSGRGSDLFIGPPSGDASQCLAASCRRG